MPITGNILGAEVNLTIEKETHEGWRMEAGEAKCVPEVSKALRAFAELLPPEIKFIKYIGPSKVSRSLKIMDMDTFFGELKSVEIKLVYKE